MFGVWGLGFGILGLGFWFLGLGFVGTVGGLYVHTLVKNILIKFLMMLFLVAKGCQFDSCTAMSLMNAELIELQQTK